MTSVRTASDRSIRVEGRHQMTQQTGPSSPTTTSAVVAPKPLTSRGATNEPMPTPRAPRLSSTPKTRAATLSGTIRATSVKAVTSTMALPMPITPAATSATAYTCQKPHHGQRHPPQAHRDRQPPHHRPAADEHRRDDGAGDERADADGALDHADAGLPAVEQVDRDHHDEHGERAADQRLQHHEEEDRADTGVAAHGLHALAHLGDEVRPAAARVVEPLVLQTQHQHRRQHPAAPANVNTDARSETSTRSAATNGPRITLTESSTPAHHVDRGELLGRPAEQRHQRGVARAVRRERDGRHDRERVDDPVRPAGDQDRRRQQGGQAADRRWSRTAPAREGAGRRTSPRPARRSLRAPGGADRPGPPPPRRRRRRPPG